MISEKYGRLTLVQKRSSKSPDGHIRDLWLCDCGEVVHVRHWFVKNGRSKSCGCLIGEGGAARLTTHGGRYTREYRSWMAMRRRCLSPTDKDYPRYGARGVMVHETWKTSFQEFLTHLGPRPECTVLDRIDPALGYFPGNVRWATIPEQSKNRRKTYVWHIKGRVFESLADAASVFKVTETSVSRWVNGAFDARRNSHTPPRKDCWSVERHPS